ncbi:MAG: hypothetical protein PHP35_01880, partial [Candidatus Colwellbacteria bacterium]|nr:hypothetical protein [Candidatus Colwellbacteria bacterium]
IHVDVSDGVFTPWKTWATVPIIKKIVSSCPGLKLAVHLMVENPDNIIGDWVESGINGIIVHCERIKNAKSFYESCLKNGVKPMIAANIETPISALSEYGDFKDFVLLAVSAGPSGQEIDLNVIPKIAELRKIRPDATIIVDGGITPETIKLIKSAGADEATSGTHIFSSSSPEKAYSELVGLAEQ